uniref:Uncharacterized protein n=1 Tax=Trichogramma kaykai TaxID=54128 RepID=A0ABD2VSK0_9HYME
MGNTPLHLALMGSHVQTFLLLLNNGADPNLANTEGTTPLHIICEKKYDDNFVELFFYLNDENQQSVQIDSRDKLGNAPLHLALTLGHRRMAEFLLKRGADPNLANEEGWTPLHIICSREREDDLMVHFFETCDELKKPVLVDAQDNKGQTPLHLALTCSHRTMAEFLLRRESDPNLAKEEG